MASSAYKSLIVVYDNDNGSQSLRHQKLTVKPGTSDTYAPLVGSVLTREYITPYKLEGTNTNVRHLNMVIDQVEIDLILPYGPIASSSLKSCVRNLLDHSSVFAGKYIGESYSNGDSANLNF
jgi:hypothetical protein